MGQPVVAVVGRPNVGKSTFFNYLAGRRIAIVDDLPGVTRDRLYAEVKWLDRSFTLIDTGGIEPESQDDLLRSMRSQAEAAVQMSDAILFMVDLKSGLQPQDADIADMLRRSGKPVVLAVNKCDQPGEAPAGLYEFYRLGLGEPMAVSSTHALGMGEVLDRLVAAFTDADVPAEQEDRIHVAIVGRPNVGKSSLLNVLSGEDRAIVSDVAGTTRDAIDSLVENDYGRFLFIDTAGMRRKARIDDAIERYSVLRSIAAIERADVVLLMVDCAEGISEQDSKIAGLAHNQGKATIIVLNKWDLVAKNGRSREDYIRSVRNQLSFMEYAPVLFTSVLTGQQIQELYPLIVKVYNMASQRVTTGVLNDVIADLQSRVQAPSYKGRRLKISYATQVSVKPPTFVLFVNSTQLLHFSYERYIENQLRRRFDFEGTPIRLLLRDKRKDDPPNRASQKRRPSSK
ncbi:ribosome biogenesis GTPase Der [Oscillospiraceae bacterium HV4-5-C5C]|nr:ribosome biogenesis GTPase Der [Oscillospiraceae bacterium HV4-5-C5C]